MLRTVEKLVTDRYQGVQALKVARATSRQDSGETWELVKALYKEKAADEDDE